MFQDDYRRRMDAVTPDPALLAHTKSRMEAVGSGARPPRRLTRRGRGRYSCMRSPGGLRRGDGAHHLAGHPE